MYLNAKPGSGTFAPYALFQFTPPRGGRPWAAAAGIRAAKTFGQSAAAVLVSSAVIQEVDWALVLGTAALAALASLATSLAGLPELPDADGDGIPDGADDSQ